MCVKWAPYTLCYPTRLAGAGIGAGVSGGVGAGVAACVSAGVSSGAVGKAAYLDTSGIRLPTTFAATLIRAQALMTAL